MKKVLVIGSLLLLASCSNGTSENANMSAPLNTNSVESSVQMNENTTPTLNLNTSGSFDNNINTSTTLNTNTATMMKSDKDGDEKEGSDRDDEDGDEKEAPVKNMNANTSVQSTTSKATSTTSTTGKTYAMTDVRSHATPDKCWTVVEGKVYDLSDWIDKHPGGDKAILGMCGKDATAAFQNQHGGQPKPEKMLGKYQIGSLK